MEEMKWLMLPLLLALTVVCYMAGLWIRKKTRKEWLHPLLTATLLVIAVLVLCGIPYDDYEKANMPMKFLMEMSVVSLGWLLYDRVRELRQAIVPILVSAFVGSVVAMASVSALLISAEVTSELAVSMVPKSITAPIAVALSETQGGIVPVTAVAVFLTGLFGALAGPLFLGKIGVTSPVARGLAIGCASHAIGTSRAIELGAVDGAVSGLAIGIMGAFTALLYPLYVSLIY